MTRPEAEAEAQATELAELAGRIERLVTDPASIRAPLVRLARPVLALFGWQPKVQTDAVAALVASLAGSASSGERRELAVGAAIDELGINVASIERATVVTGEVPVGYVAWLGRLHAVIARAIRVVASEDDAVLARVFGAMTPLRWAPPLSIAKEAEDGSEERSGEEKRERRSVPDPPSDPGSPAPFERGRPDLVALSLGTVDHLIAAADDEHDLLGRRRRLLEAARQVLLDAAAALPLDRNALALRRDHLSRAITRVDRLEGAGLALDVGLLHQARGALSAGDRARLHAALVALEAAALATGDVRVSALTGEALHRLRRDVGRPATDMRAASLGRSAVEVLGADAADAVAKAYAEGRARYLEMQERADEETWNRARTARRYLAEGLESQTLAAALGADGCFEVGGTLSPLRVVENEIRVEPVRHPTRDLALLFASDVSELPDAVVEDPRTLLLSLAAGRLLVRRYVREEVRPRQRTVMTAEVRVYVLDGSGSMHGPRARMRDAILVAELATLARRLTEAGRRARLCLFFQYFDEKLGPVHRVTTAEGALAAIGEVLGTVRAGGTDIDAALLASFEQVRQAREVDPELGRAHVVLVTDGADRVDEDAIVAARERVGDIPLGVSVIALGEENDALRSLVARQRARGERAFYHFVDDETLAALAEGRHDDGPAVHLPDLSGEVAMHASAGSGDLESLVGGLVEELAELGRARDLSALEGLDVESAARAEMGISDTMLGETARARVEALHRDRRALQRRFARWFPEPIAAPNPSPLPTRGEGVWPQTPDAVAMPVASGAARGEVDAVLVLLTTLVDIIEVTGGSELARRADAIEMLERMLVDARLSPTRYQAVLATHAVALSPALGALHRIVTSGA